VLRDLDSQGVDPQNIIYQHLILHCVRGKLLSKLNIINLGCMKKDLVGIIVRIFPKGLKGACLITVS